MQAWESIQKTLDWLEAHLDEELSVEALAEMANLSPFYYQRLFARLVKRPVMEYARLRRLARAAEHLARHEGRIVDAALTFGFASHETFTRAFKDAYGLTPEAYRASPRPLSHFLKPDLSMNYRLVDEGVPLAAEGVVLEVTRKPLTAPRRFTGFCVQNPIADTPGIDLLGELWDRLHRYKEDIPGRLPGGCELGVSFAGTREGCFSYFAGAEAGEAAPQGFEDYTLPEGGYIVCAFEAENFAQLTTEALNKARDYLFCVWLPGHGLTCEPFMAELYATTTPETCGMEIWLKTLPV